MSCGKRLSEKEKGKIDGLLSENYSHRQIAKKIKRSNKVVSSYIKLGDNYGLKGHRGRKSTIAGVLKKRVIYLASQKLMSANKIKLELALRQSKRTIQRFLNKSPSLLYKKFKTGPHLTAAHNQLD